MSQKKIIVKLVDKSIVLGKEAARENGKLAIKQPLSLTTVMGQDGQPELAFTPLDYVFGSVESSKNEVEFKEEHIVWDKPLEDFPDFEKSYTQQTSGIETATKKSGIIS